MIVGVRDAVALPSGSQVAIAQDPIQAQGREVRGLAYRPMITLAGLVVEIPLAVVIGAI